MTPLQAAAIQALASLDNSSAGIEAADSEK